MSFEEPKSLEVDVKEAEMIEGRLVVEIQKLPTRDQMVLLSAFYEGKIEGFINSMRSGKETTNAVRRM